MSVVTLHSQAKNFILLKPGKHVARTGELFQQIVTESDIPAVIDLMNASRIVAVDFETKGNDYSRFPEQHVVGVGFAWDKGSVYLDWTALTEAGQAQLLNFLLSHKGLIAHNVYFDGGWIYQMTGGQHPAWHTCTYGLYRQLAAEGFLGQVWGLKGAMIDLLGWTDTNETELDGWLVENGYVKQNKSPQKGEMWRAPAHILGKYCILDAEATYLLFTKVLEPVEKKFPNLDYYHRTDFLYTVKLHIQQKIFGILVDRERLSAHNDYLLGEIERLHKEFLSHPSIVSHVEEFEGERLREFTETEPARYKKFDVGIEPIKHTKAGKLAKSWVGWNARREKGPEVSKNWLNWQERYKRVLRGDDPSYKFNLRSGPQLRWLFYEKLGLIPSKETESGLASIDGQTLGTYKKDYLKPFLEAADYLKEQSYIQDYLDLTLDRPTIHPSYKTPGTLTGRLSSSGPNQQQMPKKKAVMSCFIPNPGNVWVDLDFKALEPHCIAEMSGCPAMNAIYGPGRPDNDIYLFVGAHIDGMKEKILATGYDPNRPTPETLARAKKECKRERTVCKLVHLSCSYGAGPGKIQQTLSMNDIDMTIEEVQKIWDMYWGLFGKVKEYGLQLRGEWRKRKGWVLNGIGRPLAVDELMTKDLLNRVSQSTGHDILIHYIRLFAEELDRREIPWAPVIIDWHDASTVEVPEQYAEEVADVLKLAVGQVNKTLEWRIKLGGEPEIGRSLSDVKQPES
jgi:hypothetical protein